MANTSGQAKIEIDVQSNSETETSDPTTRAFEQVKKEAATFVSEQVSKFNTDATNLTPIQDRLYKMIDYTSKRFDWYEEQRFKFLQVALAFVTVTAALCAFIANVRSSMPPLAVGLSFCAVATLFLTGIRLMFIYNEFRGETYPYRKIADIKSWFFKYNFEQLPAALSSDSEQSIKEVQEVGKAYKSFVERWAETAKNPRGFIEEDLQQVFILQLLQSYRHDSLKSMHSTLLWGVTIFVSFSALTVFIFFLQK